MTTSEERLLDPAPLLGALRFELGAETWFLGRRALVVRAERRPDAHLHEFGYATEELELLVDRERGLLLRVAGETMRLELTELVPDEPLAGELFRPIRS